MTDMVFLKIILPPVVALGLISGVEFVTVSRKHKPFLYKLDFEVYNEISPVYLTSLSNQSRIDLQHLGGCRYIVTRLAID